MKKTQSTGVLALGCISFLGLGMITAAIGPSLPDLARHAGSSLSSVGSVFSGLFFGALAVQILTGYLLDRIGARLIMVVSLLVLGACLGLMTWASTIFLIVLLSVFAGLGHGAVDVCLNVSVSNAFPQRRAASLNLLNVFFGLGAIIGPSVASLSLRLWGTALPALWLGAGSQLLLTPFFFFLMPQQKTAAHSSEAKAGRAAIFASPILWVMAALILIYVGVENGMGGWVSTYMQQTIGLNAANAALTASAFWLALTAGRLLAAGLGLRISATRLLQISLLAALAGALTLVLGSGSGVVSIIGILLLGLGFGPVFPTVIAKATAVFTTASGAAASLIVGSGSLGGMLIPWLQGVVLEKSGPSSAILLTLSGCLGMLVCYLLLDQLQKRARARAEAKA